MEVQRVSVPQSVQTQHEGYVVLQQTGVYGEREGKVRWQGEVHDELLKKKKKEGKKKGHMAGLNTHPSIHRAYHNSL